MINKGLLDEIKNLKSIADIGLLYCNNEYDKERYTELQNIALRLLNKVSGYSIDTLLEIFPLAVFDKRMHAHAPEPFYVYNMIFYCKTTSSQTGKGFDILDVRYFDINNLPELSQNRILKSQVELLCRKIISSDYETYFD